MVKYPFCPLCLGVRDKLNNLLELSSTIKSISHKDDGSFVVESVQSSDEWFGTALEKTFCFGCKRMCIEAKDKT